MFFFFLASIFIRSLVIPFAVRRKTNIKIVYVRALTASYCFVICRLRHPSRKRIQGVVCSSRGVHRRLQNTFKVFRTIFLDEKKNPVRGSGRPFRIRFVNVTLLIIGFVFFFRLFPYVFLLDNNPYYTPRKKTSITKSLFVSTCFYCVRVT